MRDITEIHQNYDASFKEAFSLFKDRTFDFMGINMPCITEALNCENTEIHLDKSYSDLVFKLADGKGLIMEWEASISFDDILRFGNYVFNSARNHRIPFRTIIFTNKKPNFEAIHWEDIDYFPMIINLGERNGDLLLEKIKDQIQRGDPVNELELIYLPLYNSINKTPAEMLKTVIILTNKAIGDIHKKEKILLLSALVSNKFISDEEYREIWEAIRVVVDEIKILKFAKLEGKEEGKKEGKAEGKAEGKKEGHMEEKELIAKKMLSISESIDKISQLTELSKERIAEIQKELNKQV